MTIHTRITHDNYETIFEVLELKGFRTRNKDNFLGFTIILDMLENNVTISSADIKKGLQQTNSLKFINYLITTKIKSVRYKITHHKLDDYKTHLYRLKDGVNIWHDGVIKANETCEIEGVSYILRKSLEKVTFPIPDTKNNTMYYEFRLEKI